MKENISVEAGKCCTHWLNQTFRSVIRYVLFLRGRQVLPHLGKQLFVPGAPCPGRISCAREGSHNGREPHATSRMTFHRETRHQLVSTNGMGKSFSMSVIARRIGNLN